MVYVSINIMGGLGNQLFQIATAYAYSRKENCELIIFNKKNNGNRPLYWNNLLHRCIPYLTDRVENFKVWTEIKPCLYTEIENIIENEEGIYLAGYFQSSKYFYNDTIKNEIKELFAPKDSLIDFVRTKYQYLFSNIDRIVVVHCRRTDYLLYSHIHGPLTGNYYKKALSKMAEYVENPIFLLCGDDNNFWSEIRDDILDSLTANEFFILENETDINTFVLLQQFKNFIMSNSTFIWWSVWLSNYEKVITPSKWFGEAGPNPFDDIYESDWEKMDD